jgi:hypothetical protein
MSFVWHFDQWRKPHWVYQSFRFSCFLWVLWFLASGKKNTTKCRKGEGEKDSMKCEQNFNCDCKRVLSPFSSPVSSTSFYVFIGVSFVGIWRQGKRRKTFRDGSSLSRKWERTVEQMRIKLKMKIVIEWKNPFRTNANKRVKLQEVFPLCSLFDSFQDTGYILMLLSFKVYFQRVSWLRESNFSSSYDFTLTQMRQTLFSVLQTQTLSLKCCCAFINSHRFRLSHKMVVASFPAAFSRVSEPENKSNIERERERTKRTNTHQTKVIGRHGERRSSLGFSSSCLFSLPLMVSFVQSLPENFVFYYSLSSFYR